MPIWQMAQIQSLIYDSRNYKWILSVIIYKKQ